MQTSLFPKFQKTALKARQTEAKNILQTIYTAQEMHKAEYLKYADQLIDLSIGIPDDGVYKYTIKLDATGYKYVVTAKGNLDEDDIEDTWTMNEKRELKNTINDITDVVLKNIKNVNTNAKK